MWPSPAFFGFYVYCRVAKARDRNQTLP